MTHCEEGKVMKVNRPVGKASAAVFACSMGLMFALVQPISAQELQDSCIGLAPESTPDRDFEMHGDGTVTHTATSLMWKVCSEGQSWQASAGGCEGEPEAFNWQAALQRAETVNTGGGYAGHTDWRVPNVKELASILEYKCTYPTINTNVFPNTPKWDGDSTAWSSTKSYNGDNQAMGVWFSKGDIRIMLNRDQEHVLRLVRDVSER